MPQHISQGARSQVLLLVEIGDLNLFAEPAHDLARLLGGREGFFVREVKVRVVAEQRQICQHHDAQGGGENQRQRGEPATEGQPHR